MSYGHKHFVSWSLDRDSKGHRTYNLRHKIKMTDTDDGPYSVLTRANLPRQGETWKYGNDDDRWAFCTPELKLTSVNEGDDEPEWYWYADQVFTTIPQNRCQDGEITDPILQPPDISGSWVAQAVEAVRDKDGGLLLYSNLERMRGKAVETTKSSPTVNIGMNLLNLDLALVTSALDAVNEVELWGAPVRGVRLGSATWERLLFGLCEFYYRLELEFYVNLDTFDREILDEGDRVLMPGGTATNPDHYIAAKDTAGENVRVLLDGAGRQLAADADPFYHEKQIEKEFDFLTLGIPSNLFAA